MEEVNNDIPTPRDSKNTQIENFLNGRYKFRYNIVKSRAEFKITNSKCRFRAIQKFDLNSFKRNLDKIGVFTTSENIRTVVESDFSPKVNPIHEYIKQLPRLNPLINRYIYKLSKTVTVTNSEKWEEYLTKWLVGVVANALDDSKCMNHLCLVLTGEQGKLKTSWLDYLCPKSLESYIYTGKIDPQNKDVLTLIAEYLFVNIDDQLKALNKKDENELKNLITIPLVKYRRPYDVYIEEYPHLASFMASVNGNDFLTDPTGSRRFLPFEALVIDLKEARTIDMDNVYSEAMYLLENGFRYWFNDEEIDELHRLSAIYHVQTIEYEMLIQGFDTPLENTRNHFMTTGDIINHLKRWTSLQYSEKRMGESLKKAGYERIQQRIEGKNYPIYGYKIKPKEPNPFIDREL